MDKQMVDVEVHREAGGYWAQVRGMEGCFASGASLDELVAALGEALEMYGSEDPERRLLTRVVELRLDVEPDLRSGQPVRVVSPSHRRRPSHRGE